MTRKQKKSVPPSYRYYKPRDCAIVRIHGKDYYLGEYGSPESRQRYAQLTSLCFLRDTLDVISTNIANILNSK